MTRFRRPASPRGLGKKPRVNATAARNPGGTWGIGLSNYTPPTFTDADDSRDFALHDSGAAAGDRPVGHVVMRSGIVTVSVRPLELVTLRSERAAR